MAGILFDSLFRQIIALHSLSMKIQHWNFVCWDLNFKSLTWFGMNILNWNSWYILSIGKQRMFCEKIWAMLWVMSSVPRAHTHQNKKFHRFSTYVYSVFVFIVGYLPFEIVYFMWRSKCLVVTDKLNIRKVFFLHLWFIHKSYLNNK